MNAPPAVDPVVRYTAAAIVAIAFLGIMVIVVHGYWQDPSYQLPPVLAGVLGPLLGFAATILGVHLGSATASQAGDRAAASTQASIKLGSNGGVAGSAGSAGGNGNAGTH